MIRNTAITNCIQTCCTARKSQTPGRQSKANTTNVKMYLYNYSLWVELIMNIHKGSSLALPVYICRMTEWQHKFYFMCEATLTAVWNFIRSALLCSACTLNPLPTRACTSAQPHTCAHTHARTPAHIHTHTLSLILFYF